MSAAALTPRFQPGLDPLTGVPDRAAFLHRLWQAADAGAPLAVLFLDLDDFEVVNARRGRRRPEPGA